MSSLLKVNQIQKLSGTRITILDPLEIVGTISADEVISTELIGEMKPWTSKVLPNSRWMWCKGASLLRSSYPDLWSKWYTEVDVITSTHGSDLINLSNHGFLTGECISFVGSDLPAPLVEDTEYFVIYNDENSFKVATSLNNAIAGTVINLTDDGTGTQTLYSNPWGFADSTHFYLPDLQERYPLGFKKYGGHPDMSNGVSKAFTTVHQALTDGFVNVIWINNYMAHAHLYVDNESTMTAAAVVAEYGDDINSYTKYGSAWVPIARGMYYYAEATESGLLMWYPAFEEGSYTNYIVRVL